MDSLHPALQHASSTPNTRLLLVLPCELDVHRMMRNTARDNVCGAKVSLPTARLKFPNGSEMMIVSRSDNLKFMGVRADVMYVDKQRVLAEQEHITGMDAVQELKNVQ